MDNEINLPPFYVGQRVVCLTTKVNTIDNLKIVKDKIYIINGIDKCPCGEWKVDVGLIAKRVAINKCRCGVERGSSNIQWSAAHNFAPIHENFQSISLEKVLEEETPLISVN